MACVLAVALVPSPACAVAFSDFLNGNIANSAFGSALSVGTQNFTNYALYRIYNLQNTQWGELSFGLNSLLSPLDDIESDVSIIRGYSQSLVSTLTNVSAALRNSAGSAIESLQNVSGYTNAALQVLRDLRGYNVGLPDYLYAIQARLLSDSGVSVANAVEGLGTGYLSAIAARLMKDGRSLADIVDGLGTGYLSAISARLLSSTSGLSVASIAEGIRSDMGAYLGPISSRLMSDSGVNIANAVEGLGTGYLSAIAARLMSGGVSVASLLDSLVNSGVPSIVDALGNVAITFPDSITATLAPDTSINVDSDVAGEAAQAGTLWDAVVGEVDTSQIENQMDATVGLLRTSFPFGCIFVLSDALSALAAAPIAPVFEANLPAVSGTYHAEIDLSFFDSMALLLRGGMVVIYVAGLYSATKHWVFNGGGESA